MDAEPAIARAPVPIAPPPPAGARGPHHPPPPFSDAAPASRAGSSPSAPSTVSSVSLGIAVAAIALYFVGQLVAGLAIGAWFVAYDGSTVGPGAPVIDPAVLLLAAVGGQLLGLAAALLLLRRRRVDLRGVLGVTRPVPRLLLLGTGLGVGMLVAATLAVSVLMRLTGSEQAPDQFLLDELTRGGSSTVLAFVAAVVLAPVAEELLFRGLLFTALLRRRSVHVAALVSSVVFAVVHVDVAVSQPLALVGLTLVGLALAYAYHRTGSLLVPIAGHAAFNGVTLVLALVGEQLLGVAVLPSGPVLGW